MKETMNCCCRRVMPVVKAIQFQVILNKEVNRTLSQSTNLV